MIWILIGTILLFVPIVWLAFQDLAGCPKQKMGYHCKHSNNGKECGYDREI